METAKGQEVTTETLSWPIPPATPNAVTWGDKLNPWFMFNNDEGIDEGYMPGSPQVWRAICWWFRNPFWNNYKYGLGYSWLTWLWLPAIPTVYWHLSPWWALTVLALTGGVEDRHITVTGPAPVFDTTWEDCTPPSTGWKWSIIRCGILFLPFVSYCNTWVWYVGWLPSGGRFGVKINRH